MDVTFFGQPFDSARTVGSVLTEWLTGADRFTACVAWTQASGLDHLRAPVADLRDRGGQATAIVGIDGGIATPEGLADALSTFTDIQVFHDPGSRTFHPKLYVVERGDERLVLVGSSNLTEGGLFTNYEASLAVHVRVGDADGDLLLAEVQRYLDRLRATGMPSQPLSADLIAELAARPGVLSSEADRRRAIRVQRAQAERGIRDVFGDPPAGLARAPQVPRRRRGRPPTAAPQRPAGKAVTESWSKVLTISDAMRKTAGNQRAYVILGKARHDIDKETYFRHQFFAGLNWTPEPMRTGNVKEVTRVPFEVVLEDQVLGQFEVQVDHAESRISDQDNAPTWLHWSSLLDIVRQTDLTNYTLTLERLSDETFRLRLAT